MTVNRKLVGVFVRGDVEIEQCNSGRDAVYINDDLGRRVACKLDDNQFAELQEIIAAGVRRFSVGGVARVTVCSEPQHLVVDVRSIDPLPDHCDVNRAALREFLCGIGPDTVQNIREFRDEFDREIG